MDRMLPRTRNKVALLAIFGSILASAMPALAASGGYGGAPNAAKRNAYVVTNLVSDGSTAATSTDVNLVNGWGIAASGSSPWWVADNHTGKSTLYDADGSVRTLVVAIPDDPTGIVFNGTASDFMVTGGGVSGKAVFLFAGEEGTITGWSPSVPAAGSTVAQIAVDNAVSGAKYKGLALATTDSGARLYATDFHNGKVDVFDGTFAPVSLPDGFKDPKIPGGFAPFGIAALPGIDGKIFITYAKQDADKEDDVAGQGLGFIDVFDTDGVLLGRIARHGRLNAPWGLAIAPAEFGKFSGELLVSNFGDGRINAYHLTKNNTKGLPRGALRGTDHKPIVIDGLWGIGFGNDAAAGHVNVLYFAAGPSDENHGLFGSIATAP